MEIPLMSPNFPCDLHCHTTRSDGADSVQELIDHAARQGMRIVAITDHDIIPPERIIAGGLEISPEAYAKEKGVILLKGIEISCETEVEDVHIVCLGCNWKDAFFKQLQEAVAASKIEGYRILVERLNSDGIDISWKELLENNGTPIKESQIQKKMIFELIAAKGYSSDWSSAKLMIKNNERYRINRRKPDPVNVIKEIHRCGGITILAHPHLISESVVINQKIISREEYIDILINAGLDGIEACYTYDKTSYSGNKSKEEIYTEIRQKYESRVSIMSGGSDYHADFKKGSARPRFIGECGVSEEYFYGNKLLKKLVD